MSPDPWDDLIVASWPLPAPMTPEQEAAYAEEYAREQIASAQSEAMEIDE